MIVLLGIGAGAVATLLGGSPRLLLPRPMMFQLGRYFMARDDPLRRHRYQAGWALPEVRFTSRLITVVWGSVYLGEFAIRVALIFLVAWVLVISPVLLGSLTLVTMMRRDT